MKKKAVPSTPAALWILFLFLWFPITSKGQAPVNDDCSGAITIHLGQHGFGIGTYSSDSVSIDSATIQTGEFFHSSLVTSGNDKKSVWYKFYLPTRRGLSIELKQHANAIGIKDCGFTTYLDSACLPGSSSATAAKLTALNQFGSSFNPCMDPGWYFIQVSAKARAAGKIYIEITSSYPYQSSSVLNGEFDHRDSAYDFGNTVIGKIGFQSAYKDLEIGCYSIRDSTELMKSIGKNYRAYNQSAWFTFTAKGKSDFGSISIQPLTGCKSNDTMGFRLYEGDCRGNGSLTVIDSGYNDWTAKYTCRNNCYPVVHPYPCTFDSGKTYSIQLLFHAEAVNQYRVTILDRTSQYAGQNVTPDSSKIADLGVVRGSVTHYYGFDCNSRLSSNSCGTVNPSNGIDLYGRKYQMSQWVRFKLDQKSQISLSIGWITYNSNSRNYNYLGARLFADTATSNCSDVDTANIIYERNASGTSPPIYCLDPGEYLIQLLGMDTLLDQCNPNIHLGGDYVMSISQSRLQSYNQFSLKDTSSADSINAVNDSLKSLPNYTWIYGERDTFGCENTVLPEDLCGNYTKAIYRVFTIADSDNDGVADSGFVQFSGFLAARDPNNYSQYISETRLYRGNAFDLRRKQSVSTYPDTLKGLKPMGSCFYSGRYYCLEPGAYTVATFSDNRGIGLSERPQIRFVKADRKFYKYALAEFIDSFSVAQRTSGSGDYFNCIDNPDTIDGVSCGNKNSYRVFYVDSACNASITLDYSSRYNGTRFSVFKGDIRKGKTGLTNYRNWKCQYSVAATNCDPMQPGWYTVMISDNNISFDSINRNTAYTANAGFNFHQLTITTSRITIPLPKYIRPHLAADVDSLINSGNALSYDTNYNTKAEPQHYKGFTFPAEQYYCDLDTPITHFPKSQMCDTTTTEISYYVFTLAKPSLARIITSFSGATGYQTKLYDFDVRTDSSKLDTAAPVQSCNARPQSLEFCNLQPGTYSIVYFTKRPSGRAVTIQPYLYLDSVVGSRFDHAKNAYDFGSIPGDGKFYDGKIGDVHPIDTSLPASHDIIGCRTGAQISDPYLGCYTQYDPHVYDNDTNNVLFPDSAYHRRNNTNYYYNTYFPSRNIWYTFVINGTGKATIELETPYHKYFGSNYSYYFKVYSTDEDGSIDFDSLQAQGKQDSTVSDGLNYLTTDQYRCGWSTAGTATVSIPDCDENKPRRYYIVTGVNSTAMNKHVSIRIKYDSTSLSADSTHNDYYSQASTINQISNDNLIRNGSAEAYLANWTTQSGYFQIVSSATATDGYLLFKGYYPSALNEIYQVVDVSPWSSYISSGNATLDFAGDVRSDEDLTAANDEGQIILEYLNSSGTVIDSFKSGWIASINSWKHVIHSRKIKSGVTQIKVRLQSSQKGNGNTDVYFDNLRMKINTTSSYSLPPLKTGQYYRGKRTYWRGATKDKADYTNYSNSCAKDRTVWYKFKVDTSGYLYFNSIFSYHSSGTQYVPTQYSTNYIRLLRETIPGDSINGLQYVAPTSYKYFGGLYGYMQTMCVSPGTYYLHLNACSGQLCDDYVEPQIYFEFHKGDYCENAGVLQIDTLEKVSERLLVNCHTIGTDFGEDGSNMACLYGPKGYKSSWYKVDYTDTTKVDLEFKLAEYTSATAGQIRYRAYYGSCKSLTPAPCNNNALTTFTLDCIRKGTYYIQVVTPENATGELEMSVEAKKNTDTTCNPVDIFQPNAAFYYRTSCPENVIEFVNTSSEGDSIAYAWNFGYNNQTSTEQNPTFTYPSKNTEQTYKVKLVVTQIQRGSKDSIEIDVDVPYSTMVDIKESDTILCEGDSITLHGTLSRGTGVWSTGDTSNTITVKQTGLYRFFIPDKPNLLINGNMEQAASVGWKIKSGSWSQSSYPYAREGTYSMYPYTGTGVTEMYQEVDVSSDSVEIDSGFAKTSLTGFIRSYNEAEPDEMQIILEYYDTASTLIAVYQSGFMSSVSEWLKLVHARTTPKFTRKLVVRLQVINNGNTYARGYFDDIVLKMRSVCDLADDVYVQINQHPEVNLPDDTLFCPGDTISIKIPDPTYENPYYAYEDADSFDLNGTLSGSAYHIKRNRYITLNDDPSESGHIYFTDSMLKATDTFEMSFDFWAGGSDDCRGESVYAFFFANNLPRYESDYTSGGYKISLGERYPNRARIYYRSSLLLNNSTSIDVDDETWHTVRIRYSNYRFEIYVDGVLVGSYSSPKYTQNGYKFGLGAYNSNCYNEHRVRNFKVNRNNNPQILYIPRPSQRKFTYHWDDNYSLNNRSFTTDTVHWVKVVDNYGCESPYDTIRVKTSRPYDSLLFPDEEICAELDTFRLSPVINNGFFFGNPATDSSGLVDVSKAKFGTNTYQYALYDSVGCLNLDTSVFTVDSIPEIIISGTNRVCANDTLFQLQVNNSDGFFFGGTFVDSIGWVDPSKIPGDSVKVFYRTFGNDCVGKDSFMVYRDTIPSAAIVVAGPFCENDTIQVVKPAYNTGGVFSGGTFIDSSGNFNPVVAKAGIHKVFYAFTDKNGCSNTDSTNVTVDSIPNAAIVAAGPFCENGGIQNLQAKFNSGGKFFGGTYIDSFGKFDPDLANPGIHKVFYSFTDGNGCSSTDSTPVSVDTIPNAAITPSGPFCENGGTVNLSAAINSGGKFSGGTFIDSSGTFDPSVAKAGLHKVFYSFTDGNGCSNTDSTSINVDSIPSAAIVPVGPFCENDTVQVIKPADNPGGKFSGESFIDSSGHFNPTIAKAGLHKIFYAFTDGNGCSNTDSTNVTVDSIPNAGIVSAGPFCENGGIQNLQAKFNSGGKFFGGTYIDSSGKFDPDIANPGIHKIFYSFTDGNGCSSTDSSTVSVDTIPSAAITPAGPFCENGGTVNLSAAINTGGKFSGGTFIDSAGSFDPAIAKAGLHKVFYSFTDGNGCSNTDSTSINVDSIPSAAIVAAGPFCENDTIQTIKPTDNPGGKFSGGSFIDSSGSFNPTIAKAGVHKIFYAFTDGNGCSNIDSTNVTVDSIPNAGIVSSGPFCENGGIQNLKAKFNNGGKFFGGTYIDSSGKFDPDIANPGIHKIFYSFTDGNGCLSTDSTTVSVDTIPDAGITPAGPFCENGGVNNILPATNIGGTFSGGAFINSKGSFDPAVAKTGKHRIYYSFTDGNGCSNTDSLTIQVDSIPDASIISAGPFCENDTVYKLQTVWPTGNFDSDSYIDTNGYFNPSVAKRGIHKVFYSVSDSKGCYAKDSMLITVDSIPVIQLPVSGPYCANSGMQKINATTSNNATGWFDPTSFVDSSGNFDPALADLGTNRIYYTAFNVHGCYHNDSLEVIVDSIPQIGISPAGPFCVNDDIQKIIPLKQTTGTFSGTSINAAGDFNPKNAGTGSHRIYYSFTDNNGCSATDSMQITVNDIPDASITPAGPYCSNDQTDVITTTTPGGKFSGGPWISVDGTFDPGAGQVGDNEVIYEVTNSFGCISRDTILVTVWDIPNDSIFLSSPPGCEPLEVIFRSANSTSVQWLIDQNPVSSQTGYRQTFMAGDYNVTLILTDDNGCTVQNDTQFTVYPLPIADFDFDPKKIYIGDPRVTFTDLSSKNTADWKWLFGDNDSSSDVNPIHSYDTSGNFTVQLLIVDENNCMDTAVKSLVIKDDLLYFIPSAFTPDGDGLNDLFSVSGRGIATVNCIIFNRWGEILVEDSDFESWDGTYLGSDVMSGVYIYQMTITDNRGRNFHRSGTIRLIR